MRNTESTWKFIPLTRYVVYIHQFHYGSWVQVYKLLILYNDCAVGFSQVPEITSHFINSYSKDSIVNVRFFDEWNFVLMKRYQRKKTICNCCDSPIGWNCQLQQEWNFPKCLSFDVARRKSFNIVSQKLLQFYGTYCWLEGVDNRQ